jgi:putative transposase
MGIDHSHRKQVRHFHESGDFHELTFSCYHRLPLLTNDEWRRRLSRCLDDALLETSLQLVALVYMPEHVHLLVYPTRPEPDIGRFLARLKQPFSKGVKRLLTESESPLLRKLTVRERPGKHCFRFWQEGPGFDRNIYSPEALEASIGYIHNNPVKRGLCRKATDWKWSSARYYLLARPRQQFPDLPHIHGVPPGAFDEGQPK